MKIGPVDPEIALLNLKKKKEINASKIYSPVGRFAERAKKHLKVSGNPEHVLMGPLIGDNLSFISHYSPH